MTGNAAYERSIEQGLAASLEQRSEAALALFAQACLADPTAGVPHLLIGAEHTSRGELMLAEAAFAQALLLCPGLHLARYHLGLLQFSAHRTATALATWRPLLALCDSHPLGHYVRGFTALTEDDHAASVRHFRRGLAHSRDEAGVALGVGTVLDAVQHLLDPELAATLAEPRARWTPGGGLH